MPPAIIANNLGLRGFFEHLSKNYENEYWEYEKKLGFGGFGFTALVKRKGFSGQRMAVKFISGTSISRRNTLKAEIQMLKTVNGASHIVSVFASCEDIAETWRDSNNYSQTPALGVFKGFVGLAGPAVAMEYLEHGDLIGLVNKVGRTERNVPNRILWSFFYCLIRASVGMAYPPSQPLGSDVQILEELPIGHSPQTESGMEHHDFNTRNIMLTVGDGPEHKIGVKAKLIDFGLAELKRPQASPNNIFDAALTICCLATPKAGIATTTSEYKGLPTKAVNLVCAGNPPFPLPWLDPELRDFIARCMYEDPDERPTLQQALQVTRDAVLSKTAMSFPIPDMELESAVNAFVQEFIFNVPQ